MEGTQTARYQAGLAPSPTPCISSWDERSSIRQSISIIRFPWSPNKRILDYYCRCISKALITRVSGHQLHRFRDEKCFPQENRGQNPFSLCLPSPFLPNPFTSLPLPSAEAELLTRKALRLTGNPSIFGTSEAAKALCTDWRESAEEISMCKWT